MKYTLRHLQVFLTVARHQSISKAAAELAMSQSATSAALQELENRYEVQLFDRSGKRLHLNPRGEALRVQAEALMNHAREFEQELLGQQDVGSLRLGASLTIGNYLTVKQLALYLEHYPAADVALTVGSTPEVVSKMLNLELDLGLIEAEIHHEDLLLTPWRKDRMMVFCHPSHPLASRRQLSRKDALNASWILREPDSGHRQTFDRSMQGLLPDLNIVLELTHNEAIKNAVKAGLGLGCLSEIAIADEIEQGTLTALEIQGRPMDRMFYFVTHRKMAVSNAAQRWMEMCLA
ncbi:LysR substrate-binding domain-containing protein [Pseudomaricurvus sp. HS19]|uniref:LysR substrate-binding domain-containing protein n=1 Tax=Pseudomaricurvus sp. HS19 TaxID=2692626 RepID=UPI0013696727|nr:LysR substrate-binding domain-containing protein [Pseudomaricurvus sp. HS19]MYM65148.1 LysR family transcriptional regulator [Pseudomaricurvus sp. HS19]